MKELESELNKICVSFETAGRLLDYESGQAIAKIVRQGRLPVCYPTGGNRPRILIEDLREYVKTTRRGKICPTENQEAVITGFPTQTQAARELIKALAPPTTKKRKN